MTETPVTKKPNLLLQAQPLAKVFEVRGDAANARQTNSHLCSE
jgi:hypothetical protein